MQRSALLLRTSHRHALSSYPAARPLASQPSSAALVAASPYQQRVMSSTSSAPAEAASSSNLSTSTCQPCRRTTPVMPAEEHAGYLSQLAPGWRLEPFVGSGDVAVLQKSFAFKNFRQAMRFASAVGDVAEEQKHHPEMVVGWGHVEVAWWSHAIGGLHKNDFVCAARTDKVAESAEGVKGQEAKP